MSTGLMNTQASLSRRLLMAAAVLIAVALIVSAMVLYFILHRFVQGQIDQRLDTQVVFLQSMLRADPDGQIRLDGNADGPPFDRARRGWYWQVTGPKNTLRSLSLVGAALEAPDIVGRPRLIPPPPPPGEPRPRGERPVPAEGAGPESEPLHFRILPATVSGVSVTIVASAPRQAVAGPLREAMTTLVASLVFVAIALVVAMLLQVRLGLRPLERLRRAVSEIRTGQRERLPEDQPAEIRALVTELNALLHQNTENLERARRHVANLAHGLKTPLATLSMTLSRESEPRGLIELMERRIRHHLGRARAAALGGPVRSRTMVTRRLSDLGLVLEKVYADKGVSVTIDSSPDLAVACEPQDFDEMAGNLMENAYKWCRRQVAVSALRDGKAVVLVVDDDGPGLSPDQIPEALRAGARLDESAPGFGFGLSITRELAELYGGALALERAGAGGLRARLALPAAAT
jgi:signal transduction histidine kinase